MKDCLKFLLLCAVVIIATMSIVGYFNANAQLLDTRYPGQWLDPLVEYRYIGTPKRDSKRKIIRDPKVTEAFLAHHPCPSTGLRYGECPDWSMDHVIPLACGGTDSVSNLQWLHKSVKSAAASPGFYPKDRVERLIYGQDPPIPGTDNCTFVTPERTLQ